MKQATLARWLKAVLLCAALGALAVYGFILPALGQGIVAQNPEFFGYYWPWLIFLWATGVPCCIAFVLGWRIASRIGADRSFSQENAADLKWISILAALDSGYFFLGNVVFLLLNMHQPGVLLLALIVVLIGAAISIAAAVLSHLVQKAAGLQEQSDLTI